VAVADVSIRELRNHGGDVVDRVSRGEGVTITRSGKPVAELRPLGRQPVLLDVLLARRRSLPVVDPKRLIGDLDDVIDASV